MGLIGNDCFREPFLLCHKQHIETFPEELTFTQYDLYNIRRSRIFVNSLARSSQAKDKDFYVQKYKKKKTQGVYSKEKKPIEEEGSISINGNDEVFDEINNLRLGDLLALLKACAKRKDLQKGIKLHAQILKRGLLGKSVYVGSIIINMYAKCGALEKAQEAFDELPIRNVVSWTALITGYTQNGHGEEALKCYDKMQQDGFSPDAVTIVSILKACGMIGEAEKGEEIHTEIRRQGLLDNIFVFNALVDMYAKCGKLAKAQEVFDEFHVRDVVSWNALIGGYAYHGHGEEALNLFERMKINGISPDEVTFVCILNACGTIGAIKKGQQIHREIIGEGLLKRNIIVGNALVDMYAKCGDISKAKEVFDELPLQNVVSWTTLITGYVKNGNTQEALNCFQEMFSKGISPNVFTFISILRACGNIKALEKGQEIHTEIVKMGLLGKSKFSAEKSLVDMYAKCGALVEAQEVFDKLPGQDTSTWNSLISGYSQYGHSERALNCFKCMQYNSVRPDGATFVCILNACGNIRAEAQGHALHAQIVNERWLEKDIMVGNALVDMYVKFHALTKAQAVFDVILVRNVVTWTALIAGYAQYGYGEEALKCYGLMQEEGISPNTYTFACILKACGSIGADSKAHHVHAEIIHDKLPEKDIRVGTALVDMYAKCGALTKAQEVFDALPFQDLISWNSLMRGYAQIGHNDSVFDSFKKMVEKGIIPDQVTFSIVLNACCHSGLVDKGSMYFDMMKMSYGAMPTLDHYTCMIGLYGRAGQFDKAMAMIEEMPFPGDFSMWCTLLGACHKWGKVQLGRLVFEHAIQFDEKNAVPYVCMNNIYTAAGMLEEAQKIEAMRLEKDAKNNMGEL